MPMHNIPTLDVQFLIHLNIVKFLCLVSFSLHMTSFIEYSFVFPKP